MKEFLDFAAKTSNDKIVEAVVFAIKAEAICSNVITVLGFSVVFYAIYRVIKTLLHTVKEG